MKLFNRLKSLSKLQLVLLIAVFAAIPVTVGGVVAYRLVSPQAATGKPTSLTPAYSSTSTTPTFRWDCFCYTTKYRVHLREGDGNFYAGSWYKDVSKGSSNITSTSYSGFRNNNYKPVPASLTPGKTYYWTVSCVTGGCTTATTMAFTVVSTDTTKPSRPTNLRVTAADASGVTVAWNASTDNVGVTGYKIGWGTAESTTTGLSFKITQIVPATVSVQIDVRAFDARGNESDRAYVLVTQPDRDYDNDGFHDSLEVYVGTNAARCNTYPSIPDYPAGRPPDFNRDNVINATDQLLLAQRYGTSERRYDLNRDGVVNNLDLNFMAPFYNTPCPSD